MFKYADKLLQESEKNHEKLFLVILSTTNHPPYKVPDNEKTIPRKCVPFERGVLSDPCSKATNVMMDTYYYANDSLGEFVSSLRKQGLLKKTLLVVTGDHNARFNYEPQGYFHRQWGVPILMWIPEAERLPKQDLNKWVGHSDIFPTLKELVLGIRSDNTKGKNILTKDSDGFSTHFSDWPDVYSFGKDGSVKVLPNGDLVCYEWKDDQMVKAEQCSEKLQKMGEITRAQSAITWYEIRKELLGQ